MKVLLTLYVAAVSLLQIRNADSARCVDDHDYNYDGKKNHNCVWIARKENRRQSLCLKKKVAQSCPVTCGICCQDDRKFKFKLKSGKKEKCTFLVTKPKKKNWCDQISNKEIMIRNACPKTCDACFDKVNAPTQSPTDAPTNLPTPKPRCADSLTYVYEDNESQTCNWIRKGTRRETLCLEEEVALGCPISCGVCCENNLNYSFTVNTGSVKKCRWLYANEDRKMDWCEEFSNGRKVKRGCPKVCDACFPKITATPTAVPTFLPTSKPTIPPTEAPTKAPTETPTKAPTKAPVTTAPTKAPINPVNTPTISPTVSPNTSPNSSKAPTQSSKAPSQSSKSPRNLQSQSKHRLLSTSLKRGRKVLILSARR